MARTSAARSIESSGADGVAALERGFKVLDCFAAARRSLANREVAAMTGIPRPSVTRLIGTLVALGHLRPAAEPERWELAAGVVRLAQAFLGAIDIRSFARPHIVKLAEEVGASAFVGLREGSEMLVIEAARARSAVAVMGADVGTRMALGTSALGRAWLAGVDESTRAAVQTQLTASSQLSDAQVASMEHAVATARAAGYALSLGEWHTNINAVAVPVQTPGGEVISINCGSPAFVLPAERLTKVVLPGILATAEAIARDIGGISGATLTNPDAASRVPLDAPPSPSKTKTKEPASKRPLTRKSTTATE